MQNAIEQARENCASAVAEHLWLNSVPVKGTLAERYLRETLSLDGPLPEILGFREKTWCPVYEDYTPSLICPIYDRGAIVAIHQTFLCAETRDAWRTLRGEPVAETLGPLRTGAAWLGVPDTTLGLAGSVEAALAASSRFSLPVWAVCDERRIADIWIPDEVEALIVFTANGAGEKAKRAFGHRMRVSIERLPK